MIIYPELPITSSFYPKWFGFGNVFGALFGAHDCPNKTSFETGRGCCLPAAGSVAGKKTCCNATRKISVHTNAAGLLSLVCKDAQVDQVNGNGGGGTRRRNTGFEDPGTVDTTTPDSSTLLLLGGAGLVLYMLFKKKKPAAASAAPAGGTK